MKLDRLSKRTLLIFNHILVVSTGYILSISIGPVLKGGKLQSITSSAILGNLFKDYFKGIKLWWLFPQLYKNSIDRFVLEVSTVDTMSRS